MKKVSFNLTTYYDIDVVSAREGDKIRLGTATITMPHVIGQAIMRREADGQAFFAIVFNSEADINIGHIAHECFHMFFEILRYMGETNLSPAILANEVYAVMFEDLMAKTVNALCRIGVLK